MAFSKWTCKRLLCSRSGQDRCAEDFGSGRIAAPVPRMQEIADVLLLPLAHPLAVLRAEPTHALEVNDPHLPGAVDQEVLRFEVVVPDAQLIQLLPNGGNL